MKDSQRQKNQQKNQQILQGLRTSINNNTDRPFDFQIDGNTFHWKEELKGLGFRWEPYRCWYRTFSGVEEIAHVIDEIMQVISASKHSLIIGIGKANSTRS